MTDLDSYKQELKEFYGNRTTYDHEKDTETITRTIKSVAS